MPEQNPGYEYRIGDAVLAEFGGAQIPGTVQDAREGRFLVNLSRPWADESGNESSTVWLTGDRLSRLEGGVGEQALPG